MALPPLAAGVVAAKEVAVVAEAAPVEEWVVAEVAAGEEQVDGAAVGEVAADHVTTEVVVAVDGGQAGSGGGAPPRTDDN